MEVGRVVHIHIRDDLMDMEKLYVKTDQNRASSGACTAEAGMRVPAICSRWIA